MKILSMPEAMTKTQCNAQKLSNSRRVSTQLEESALYFTTVKRNPPLRLTTVTSTDWTFSYRRK